MLNQVGVAMNQIEPRDSVMSPKEDVIDVEFETIAAQNSSSDAKINNQASAPTDSEQVDTDQLAVFGAQKTNQGGKAMSLPLFTLIAAVCSVGAFYLAGGHILFSTAPVQSTTQTALAIDTPVQAQSLKIENVSSNLVERSNLSVLTIRATIANYDEKSKTVPTIIVRLGDDPATGRMFRINRGETLRPGERLVFTNSLPVGNAPETQPVLTFAE